MADTFQRMLGNNGSKMAAQLIVVVEAVAGNSACWFACSGLVSACRVRPNESPEPVDAYEAGFALLLSRALPATHATDMARLISTSNYSFIVKFLIHATKSNISAQIRQRKMSVIKVLQFSGRHWKYLIQMKAWAYFDWKSEEKQAQSM